VSLCNYTLSPDNPNRAALEAAYRDFESATRPYFCTACHNPGNPANVNPLVFFTHPSQALVARHDIVRRLQANTMPPKTGIADEKARQNLIVLPNSEIRRWLMRAARPSSSDVFSWTGPTELTRLRASRRGPRRAFWLRAHGH